MAFDSRNYFPVGARRRWRWARAIMPSGNKPSLPSLLLNAPALVPWGEHASGTRVWVRAPHDSLLRGGETAFNLEFANRKQQVTRYSGTGPVSVLVSVARVLRCPRASVALVLPGRKTMAVAGEHALADLESVLG